MFSIDADIRTPGPGGRHAVIADRDAQMRALLSHHLQCRGFRVSEAHTGLDALTLIGNQAPSLAILSCDTPDGQEDEECQRTVALVSMLYPRTRLILAADHPLSMPEDSPFLILSRPVNLDQIDRCLDGLVA
eukprot:TRINITY_DN23404_c0_g1_i1.p2 TRINITY_DN23404_c0_g1~~TRINITY_DN23404_c0_g1_i1.p2  ORF type:complete len:132 (+),score=14.38 TRINITY_DN23404_c0_g1_i1:237-632(+)